MQRCLCLFGLGLSDFVVSPIPRVRRMSTDFTFFSTHFFSSLVTFTAQPLLSFKHSAFCVAFKAVLYTVYALSWYAFPHLLSSLASGKGLDTFSLRSFQLLCISVHAFFLLYCTVFVRTHGRCIFSCSIMLQCHLCYMLGCTRYKIFCIATFLALT